LAIQENAAQVWRLGVFKVDARNAKLCRNGVPIRVREQSFRALVYLLEHAGQLVSREDLRRVLWPADTFVDFDHSLNTAMMKLRDALGDLADAPVYIETIPKRGYRFIAPVSQPAEPPTQTVSPTPLAAQPPRLRRRQEPLLHSIRPPERNQDDGIRAIAERISLNSDVQEFALTNLETISR
jgi:DNA-binding winged helix-turn-helix (wHTH) protein